MKASQNALDDWNAAVEVETANASTALATQRSHHWNCPDYCSLSGRAPALQSNEDITSPQVNQELIDTPEDATKVEQENEEVYPQKYYAVHVFSSDKLTTYENFKNHGMESACPMIDEHKRLFISPWGD